MGEDEWDVTGRMEDKMEMCARMRRGDKEKSSAASR